MIRRFALGGLLTAALCVPAWAGVGLSAGAGTLGLGLTLSAPIVPGWVDARLLVNGGRITRHETTDGLRYKGRAHFRNAALLADLYPFGGIFRVTGGVYYDDNRVDLTGTPVNGIYTVNGYTVPAAAVGPVTGRITYARFAPYLGLGVGNGARPGAGFTYGVDLGVMWDRPTTTLNAPGAAYDPALAAEIASVRAQIEQQANRLKAYPVISVSLGYRF